MGAQSRFEHRRTLSVQTLGWDARARLQALDCVSPAEAPAWESVSGMALELAQTAFDRLGPLRTLRLHGDCHPGNILWREEGPHVVDLDDACNGPAVQDFWMLLSGDAAGAERQLQWMLEGYRQFREFDEAELQLIEPLRTLRMIHHAAWIAERWADPAFPRAFPWFGTPAYWSQLSTQLREQIEKMGECPG